MDIIHNPTTIATSGCNPQDQSPLYSKLPGELRNAIFTLALTEYEDPARKYEFASYHYRPGYTAQKRIATELLLTCRRVYLEAWFLPGTLAEHTWWLGTADRVPLERRKQVAGARPLAARGFHFPHSVDGRQPEDPAAAAGGGEQLIQRARVFAQQFAFEHERFSLFSPWLADACTALPALRTLTLAVRYTDNWFWEGDRDPHVRSEAWVVDRRLPSALARFVVEWETIAKKRKLLDAFMADAARRWRFRRMDGAEMACDGRLESYEWRGTAMFDGRRFDHHGHGLTMEYYVVKATWRPVGADAAAADG